MMEQLAACCQTTHGIHPQNLRQSCRLGLSTSRHEQSSRALSRSCFRGYPELGMKNASVTACLVALNHVPLGQSFDNMGINTAYRKKQVTVKYHLQRVKYVDHNHNQLHDRPLH